MLQEIGEEVRGMSKSECEVCECTNQMGQIECTDTTKETPDCQVRSHFYFTSHNSTLQFARLPYHLTRKMPIIFESLQRNFQGHC